MVISRLVIGSGGVVGSGFGLRAPLGSDYQQVVGLKRLGLRMSVVAVYFLRCSALEALWEKFARAGLVEVRCHHFAANSVGQRAEMAESCRCFG